MLGRQQRASRFGGLHRLAISRISRVRFRCGGNINHRLGDSQFAFRTAEEVVGFLRRIGDHQRLWIGQADVLHRHAHDAAREIERILAGIDHTAEIIQGGVGI